MATYGPTETELPDKLANGRFFINPEALRTIYREILSDICNANTDTESGLEWRAACKGDPTKLIQDLEKEAEGITATLSGNIAHDFYATHSLR